MGREIPAHAAIRDPGRDRGHHRRGHPGNLRGRGTSHENEARLGSAQQHRPDRHRSTQGGRAPDQGHAQARQAARRWRGSALSFAPTAHPPGPARRLAEGIFQGSPDDLRRWSGSRRPQGREGLRAENHALLRLPRVPPTRRRQRHRAPCGHRGGDRQAARENLPGWHQTGHLRLPRLAAFPFPRRDPAGAEQPGQDRPARRIRPCRAPLLFPLGLRPRRRAAVARL